MSTGAVPSAVLRFDVFKDRIKELNSSPADDIDKVPQVSSSPIGSCWVPEGRVSFRTNRAGIYHNSFCKFGDDDSQELEVALGFFAFLSTSSVASKQCIIWLLSR